MGVCNLCGLPGRPAVLRRYPDSKLVETALRRFNTQTDASSGVPVVFILPAGEQEGMFDFLRTASQYAGHQIHCKTVVCTCLHPVIDTRMENYSKGEVKEVNEPPIFQLSDTGIEMKVNAGSKIRNLMGFAMKKMKEPAIQQMSWNGSGNAINKAITCAEIMKRKHKTLHQITKIKYRRIEEYWEPKVEGLERLKVNRDIPAVSILLSKNPLDSTEPGYQPPGPFDVFWKSTIQDSNQKQRKPRPRGRYRDNNVTFDRKKFKAEKKSVPGKG